MTIPTWPDRLPLPTIAGYGMTPADTILRTEMESGNTRTRRRFTRTIARVTAAWVMRDDQYMIFEAWFEHRALGGAAWFSARLYGGMGTHAQEARFVQPYQATPLIGDRWQITATLEVRNRPMLSDGGLSIAMTEDTDGLQSAIAAFGDLVNRTLPDSL